MVSTNTIIALLEEHKLEISNIISQLQQPEPEPEPEALLSVPSVTVDLNVGNSYLAAHEAKYEISQGTIITKFTLNDVVSGMCGIVSKDAAGYGQGGHFGIYTKNDALYVRLQNESAQKEILLENVLTAQKEHKVAVQFNDRGTVIFLDDQKVASTTFVLSLVNNKEPWVIGANQWGSTAETADKLLHAFNGTVHETTMVDVLLYDHDVSEPTPTPVPPPVSNTVPQPNTTPTSGSNLSALLQNASPGDVINLSPGSHGLVNLKNFKFTDFVTVNGTGSKVTGIFVDNCEGLHFTGFEVDNLSAGGAASKLVSVTNSKKIHVSNCDIHGLIEGTDYQGWYGVYTGNTVENFTLENCFIHHVKNAIVMFSTKDSSIINNKIDWIGNDAMKFGGNDGLLIKGNWYGGHCNPAPGAHTDFIQFQGGANNLIISDNFATQARGYASFQGIFLSDASFHNVLIENNVVNQGHIRAISVSAGSNIVARYNTCLNTGYQVHKASLVLLPEGSVSAHNIVSHAKALSGPSGSNLTLQYDDPNANYYYNDYYVNAMKFFDLTKEDLKPVPGSAAETSGAFKLLLS